jgi:polyisoprenoid-binding protein YceI
MESTATSIKPAGPLPTGVWTVDPAASALEFKARGMFGLVPVRGTFGEYTGELHADESGAHGELRIAAASLDTGNSKRDSHLRSADFFDVDQSPTVTFSLLNVEQAGTGLLLRGALKIRDNSLEISAPLAVSALAEDRLAVETTIDVDRAAAGVGWSKLGMIQGAAQLHAKLTLERGDSL